MGWFSKETPGLWRVEAVSADGRLNYVPSLDKAALEHGHATNLKEHLRKSSAYISFCLVRDGEETE